MSKPCIRCKKPYPTDEFIDAKGLCIICGGKPISPRDLIKKSNDITIEIGTVKVS